MNPELQKKIDRIAYDSPVVCATMRSCHHQGLNEADMLANIIINLVTANAHLEARLMEIISLTPPSTLAQQITAAQAETATWPQEKRYSVRLAGSSEPKRGSINPNTKEPEHD